MSHAVSNSYDQFIECFINMIIFYNKIGKDIM